MQILHLIKTIVKEFSSNILQSDKDLTYPFQLMPWEYIHKKNMKESLVLSRTTGAPMKVHLDFTPDKQEIILRGILESNKPATCARLAKIEPDTLQKWLKLGEKGIAPYKNFYMEFNQAEALAQARDVRVLREGGWKGAEALLKLRWGWQESIPEKFLIKQQMKEMEKENININLHNETNINIKPLSDMKDEEKKLELFRLLDEANKGNMIIDHD